MELLNIRYASFIMVFEGNVKYYFLKYHFKLWLFFIVDSVQDFGRLLVFYMQIV